MNLFESFGLCLAVIVSGLLLGIAHILYQHRFTEDKL